MQGHVLTVVLTVGLAVRTTGEEGGERLEDPVAGKSHRLLSNAHLVSIFFNLTIPRIYLLHTIRKRTRGGRCKLDARQKRAVQRAR